MGKRALITGITGQDAAYLAQLLLSKGYTVVGARRRSASGSLWRLEELGIADQIGYVPFDLLELPSMFRMLEHAQPDEIYNLAAQSFVAESFEQPLVTADVDAMGVLRLLEAVRVVCPKAKFYQASSSEMYGNSRTLGRLIDDNHGNLAIDAQGRRLAMLNESTVFAPRSPYGIAKLFAYWAARNYREGHGMFVCNGILFNHESKLRGMEFVTRKITHGLARIAAGEDYVLRLGNLDASRDWGHARCYVDAMWRMLQHDTPDDYVVATGETHSVGEFLHRSACAAGLIDEPWDGGTAHGDTWAVYGDVGGRTRTLAESDTTLRRPAEIDVLLGDASKAKRVLDWLPSVSFAGLVTEMVQADMRRISRSTL